MPKDEFKHQRKLLMKQALKSVVDTKLLYLDFLRQLPDDKREEALANIQERVNEAFHNSQVPEALKKNKLKNAAEYDAFLRRFGSSLDKERRTFMERMMGKEMVRRNVRFDRNVSHQEMLQYYHANAKDYELPARAKWERLTVRFDRFPSKYDAWQEITEMGNSVMRNAPFHEVAKRRSHGAGAAKGGFHDWTEKGSLRSEDLDNAIFSLPLNRLSNRIEDDRGFHIIRVVERHDAGKVPFREAQVSIKKELRKASSEKEIAEYIAKLRKQTPVRSIFDTPEKNSGTRQAQLRQGEPRRK